MMSSNDAEQRNLSFGPSVRIRSPDLFRILATTAGFLVVSDAILKIVAPATGVETITDVRRMFDLDGEQNVPAMYSSALLFLAGVLLLIMASCHRHCGEQDAWMWFALGGIFGYLAVDELVGLHERLSRVLRFVIPGRGLLRFTWVVAAIPGVALLGIVYRRAVWALPERTRWQFILAGAVFIGGAVGIEMLGGWCLESSGRGFAYHALVAVEESMEMLGVIIFIRALVEHIAGRFPEVRVRFEGAKGVVD